MLLNIILSVWHAVTQAAHRLLQAPPARIPETTPEQLVAAARHHAWQLLETNGFTRI